MLVRAGGPQKSYKLNIYYIKYEGKERLGLPDIQQIYGMACLVSRDF